MSDVAFRRAVDLARMIRSKEVCSVELTEHYVARLRTRPGRSARRPPWASPRLRSTACR